MTKIIVATRFAACCTISLAQCYSQAIVLVPSHPLLWNIPTWYMKAISVTHDASPASHSLVNVRCR